MTQAEPETPPNVPFGTHPRRSAWPLAGLIVVFLLWFAFLVWLAVRFPAR